MKMVKNYGTIDKQYILYFNVFVPRAHRSPSKPDEFSEIISGEIYSAVPRKILFSSSLLFL